MIKPQHLYLEHKKFELNEFTFKRFSFLLFFFFVFFGNINALVLGDLVSENYVLHFQNKFCNPPNVACKIEGLVKDEKGELLVDVKVELLEENGNIVKTIYTNKAGVFNFEVKSNKTYNLIFSKLNYNNFKNKINVDDLNKKQKITVKLKKQEVMSLYGLVVDSKNKEALEGVKVTIIDKLTEKVVDVFVTSEAGDFIKLLEKKVGDTLKYSVRLEKKDYTSKTVDFEYLIKSVGEIRMHDVSSFTLSKF